jgi:hypothetical protein
MPGKKENNKKNYQARVEWLTRKQERNANVVDKERQTVYLSQYKQTE